MHITMKYIRAPDMLPHLAGLANAWRIVDQAGGHDYLEAVFTYILDQAEISNLDKLFELIQESLSNNSQENVMTIAQQLIERGRQEAMTIAQQLIERGRQEGRQQGQFETAEAIAKRLLQTDFSIEQVARFTTLPPEIVAKLEQEQTVT